MNRHKHPELYMKRPYHKTYFEGWYFKQVDQSATHTISFIPSVSFSKGKSMAFLQVIYQNGTELVADVCTYDIAKFKTENDTFRVMIDKNCFTEEALEISFKGQKLAIEGKINFSAFTRLDYSFFNPNIMGALSYYPFLPCNHGVISMNHQLSGTLNINGAIVSFDNGKGYLEKDWGSSFPENYIWIHCNHFNSAGASLFFSIADIPVLFTSVKGFICNLLINNKQYRFATYTGAKINLKTTDDKVEIVLQNRRYLLSIVAFSSDSKDLLAPQNGEMTRTIKESLKGNVTVKLKDKKTERTIFKDASNHVSIEMV